MIDTHAHIYLEEFDNDLSNVIESAQSVGITNVLMPNIDSTTIERMLGVEDMFGGFCRSMMGLHPCSVKDDFEVELNLVEEWLGKRKFIAVGEIGTDLYWDKTFFEQQKEAFRIQCEFALKYKLPIVIHCRNSIDENIELLDPFISKGLKGVFHCFGGTLDQAKKIIERGFLLGIGGVVTFKNGGLEKVLPHVDLENILLETDSPYLAPTPNRGKRNEPSYLSLIAQKIESIHGDWNYPEIKEVTSKNAQLLFESI